MEREGKDGLTEDEIAFYEALAESERAVDNGEFDILLEEQLAYGSHLKKYL